MNNEQITAGLHAHAEALLDRAKTIGCQKGYSHEIKILTDCTIRTMRVLTYSMDTRGERISDRLFKKLQDHLAMLLEFSQCDWQEWNITLIDALTSDIKTMITPLVEHWY